MRYKNGQMEGGGIYGFLVSEDEKQGNEAGGKSKRKANAVNRKSFVLRRGFVKVFRI